MKNNLIKLFPKKKIKYVLLKIFGVGLYTASKILTEANISTNKYCIELSKKNIAQIFKILQKKYCIENDLKKKIQLSIKLLIQIKCLRGKRHILKLPVRGQRTHTNAQTSKKRPKYF